MKIFKPNHQNINHLKRWGKIPKYYIDRKDFKIITKDEILPYIYNTDDIETKVVIALAWSTGARIQEIVNLKKEDFIISDENRDLTISIKALKFGKIGYPSFSFDDPFVKELIIPYVRQFIEGKIFSRTKRTYQKKLENLNKKIHGDNIKKWITFHYLRHSLLTYMGRVLRAFPEEFKSWTGHRSQAFEEYYAPRKVDRFKGKFDR